MQLTYSYLSGKHPDKPYDFEWSAPPIRSRHQELNTGDSCKTRVTRFNFFHCLLCHADAAGTETTFVRYVTPSGRRPELQHHSGKAGPVPLRVNPSTKKGGTSHD